MRTSVILEIIQGIGELPLDDAAKRQVNRLVSQVALRHGVSSVTHAERVNLARRLLDAKVSRATIRMRLMATYEIQKSHAYRIIATALNCPKTPH
jgi:hypothetical protein